MFVLFYYIGLKWVHLRIANEGNRIESSSLMIVQLVLGAFCVFTNVYFCAWQTYIMWIELVLNLGAVGFSGIEICSGAVCFCIFRAID